MEQPVIFGHGSCPDNHENIIIDIGIPKKVPAGKSGLEAESDDGSTIIKIKLKDKFTNNKVQG